MLSIITNARIEYVPELSRAAADIWNVQQFPLSIQHLFYYLLITLCDVLFQYPRSLTFMEIFGRRCRLPFRVSPFICHDIKRTRNVADKIGFFIGVALCIVVYATCQPSVIVSFYLFLFILCFFRFQKSFTTSIFIRTKYILITCIRKRHTKKRRTQFDGH